MQNIGKSDQYEIVFKLKKIKRKEKNYIWEQISSATVSASITYLTNTTTKHHIQITIRVENNKKQNVDTIEQQIWCRWVKLFILLYFYNKFYKITECK